MQRRFYIAAIALWLAGPSPLTLYGQNPGSDLSVRNIRVKKLAQDWQNRQVRLRLADGRLISGRLVATDFYQFTLESAGKRGVYPLEEVSAVILTPGLIEVALTAGAGLLIGGFGLGLVTLSTPEASTNVQGTAGLVGALLGGWWGYKTFYQEVVVDLD